MEVVDAGDVLVDHPVDDVEEEEYHREEHARVQVDGVGMHTDVTQAAQRAADARARPPSTVLRLVQRRARHMLLRHFHLCDVLQMSGIVTRTFICVSFYAKLL